MLLPNLVSTLFIPVVVGAVFAQRTTQTHSTDDPPEVGIELAAKWGEPQARERAYSHG